MTLNNNYFSFIIFHCSMNRSGKFKKKDSWDFKKERCIFMENFAL